MCKLLVKYFFPLGHMTKGAAMIDVRKDNAMAMHVRHALQLQVDLGFERAYEYLINNGVDAKRTRELLAVRFERRKGNHEMKDRAVGFLSNGNPAG